MSSLCSLVKTYSNGQKLRLLSKKPRQIICNVRSVGYINTKDLHTISSSSTESSSLFVQNLVSPTFIKNGFLGLS